MIVIWFYILQNYNYFFRANIEMDDFEDVQKALQFYILCGIEEEIGALKKYMYVFTFTIFISIFEYQMVSLNNPVSEH